MNQIKKVVDALTALKSLESFGYSERQVEIAKVKILLAPLTSQETIDVFESCAKYNDADAATHTLKVETIARSIIAINDVKLDPKSFVDDKRQIVLSFGDELVEMLFNEYCILDGKIKSSIDKKLGTEQTEIVDGTEQ